MMKEMSLAITFHWSEVCIIYLKGLFVSSPSISFLCDVHSIPRHALPGKGFPSMFDRDFRFCILPDVDPGMCTNSVSLLRDY